MLTPQFLLDIHRELAVDLFAGGGGASTGMEQAIGRPVDIAINHDPAAVALHQANHPQTQHFVSDVFEVDPLAVTDGRPVGLLWASPDCKHFSKAKGGKPVSRKIRGLAWVVVKWAKLVKPRVICLENVEEFQTWGPLAEDGRPCPNRKGRTFRRWKRSLEALGYTVEHRELRGCDYGAPTIRKRLFLVARRDQLPIVWPAPSHGAPGTLPVRQKKLKPWPFAADCIDCSIPCPSIFERERPLAEATLRRIAKGVMRYVVEAAEPFIVPIANWSNESVQPIREPLRTITAWPRGGQHALVTAFLAQYNNHGGTEPNDGRTVEAPLSTVTAKGCQQALVTSHIVKLRGTSKDGQPATEPLHTISAQGWHHGEVRAFLIRYYSEGGQWGSLAEPMHTIPTKDRLGLVMVRGEPYAIVDIGLRMLSARELYRAQGFPETYITDRGADGRVLTKTEQVRMCGNSVCPPLARAIVAANYHELVEVGAEAA
jgi:DNA (cytosine-5)-methyltransferase 1